MIKIRALSRFLLSLFFLLAIAFGFHVWILFELELGAEISKLLLSYLINGAAAILLFRLITIFISKKSEILGFLFLIGSLLKFILFFSVFRPVIFAGLEDNKSSFSYFFVPYAVCLSIEVFHLVKELNNQYN